MRMHLGTLAAAVLVTCAAWSAGQQEQQQQQGGRGGVSPPVVKDQLHVPIVKQRQVEPPQRIIPQNPIQMPQQDQPRREPREDRTRPVLVARDPGIWDEKTWLCWWETNRDAVLAKMLRRNPAAVPGTPPGAKPPEERERAVKALTQALAAERPPLRAAAAVSLGQMREESALKPLLALAASDPDARVKGYAWAAVGLIGTADAHKALVTAKPKSEFELLGILAGIGLTERPPEAAFQQLHTLIAKPPSPEVARMAMWALRAHRRAADHDVIRASLGPNPVPPTSPVVSEALLALGALSDPRDVDYLANVAAGGYAADVPDTTVVESGGTGSYRNRNTYQAPISSPGGPIAPHGQSGVSRTSAVPNNPSARLDRHRSTYPRVSASLALGTTASDTAKPLAASSVLARNVLIRNFAGFLDMGGPSYTGASIISFALSTADRDVYLIRNVLDLGTDPFIGLVNARSPMRGFAAVGLGLYMQNGGKSQIPSRLMENGVALPGFDTTLPEYIDVNETLALRFTNKQEASDIRAACALALGLGGNPASARRLIQGAESIDRRDELLLGYTTLALALLGDKSAINAAGPLLGGAGKIDPDAVATRGVPTPGVRQPLSSARNATTAPAWEAVNVPQDGPAAMSILGRRAALLGISLLDDPRTQPILAAAWARDRATVRDVARAIGWTRAYALADPLTQIVEKNQKGAVEAAASLGWVFDPDRPSRLSRLVIGNNYHQPQADYVDGAGPSQHMLRDFPRLGDFYLYSTPLGGNPATAARR